MRDCRTTACRRRRYRAAPDAGRWAARNGSGKEYEMTKQSIPSPKGHRALSVLALVFVSLSLLWYASQVFQFGFPTVAMVDLLGLYFLLNCIGLVILLRTQPERVAERRFLFFVCTLAIPVSALFLGQFLSTFDPFYNVGHRLYPYLLRGLFLGTAVTALFALRPRRFFDFPWWLLVLVCLVTAGWLFVYACPSTLREWYGTRTAPSELFPKGMLMFDRPNPERGIQTQMLVASVIAWSVMIVLGRLRHRKASVKKTIAAQPIRIETTWKVVSILCSRSPER